LLFKNSLPVFWQVLSFQKELPPYQEHLVLITAHNVLHVPWYFCSLFYFECLYRSLLSFYSFGNWNSDPLFSRAGECSLFFLCFVSIPFSCNTWRGLCPYWRLHSVGKWLFAAVH